MTKFPLQQIPKLKHAAENSTTIFTAEQLALFLCTLFKNNLQHNQCGEIKKSDRCILSRNECESFQSAPVAPFYPGSNAALLSAFQCDISRVTSNYHCCEKSAKLVSRSPETRKLEDFASNLASALAGDSFAVQSNS